MNTKPIDASLSAVATARLRALESHYKASTELKRAEETLRALELTTATLLQVRKETADAPKEVNANQ